MAGQGSGTSRTTSTRRSAWRGRVDALLPARLRGRSRDRHSRGAAELSVLVVTGSLVAGVFFGQGISSTAVDVADGLTWLSDEPNGQIIQVNPATGKLEVKQVVGNPGDDLEVTAERNGQLYVADHTSGRLLALDLTSILVSGQRRISTGGAVDTIYNDDGVFLVDGEQSTIAAMDPSSTEALGSIWVAPSGLADAAVDGKGTIWALEDDGTLHRLAWSAERMAFDDDDGETVDGSGEGSVLVAHDEGVTVFGPDQGLVAQVGTDHDLAADAPKVIGKIYAPEKSPTDLVPVAAADNGYVVLLTPEGIIEVDMGSIDCGEPGTPEVFNDRVYVPCIGEGRVVRLGPDGRRADKDIPTPGSDDPELILDDDNLIINAPGAPQGVVVHDDGSTTTITREDDAVPANGLTSSTTPPQNPAQDLIDDLLDLGGNDEEEDSPPPAPSNPGPSTPPPTTTGGGPGSGNGNGGGGNGGGNGATPPRCDDPTTPGAPSPTGNGGPSGQGTPTSPAPTSPTSGPTSPPTTSAKGKGGGKGKGGCGNGGGTTGGGGNGGGSGGSAGQPVTAPTDVTAEAMAEGQVRLTWRHSAIPKADAFVIRASNGQTFKPLKGWVRESFVDAPPGVATTFTVTAVVGSRVAPSSPSNTVITTARPGAPQVAGTAAYKGNNNEEIFAVEVRWAGATANGKSITGYDVAITTTNGGQQTQTLPGNQDRTEFTWTCSRQTDADCKVGGDYEVTVVARNELGQGQVGVFRGVAPAQPPPPLPAGNRQVVDGSSPKTSDAAPDGSGSIVLKLKPPTDWARFPGTCLYSLDGGTALPLACNAATVTVSYNNGTIYEPDTGSLDHRVVFLAQNDRGTATSAGYTFTTKQTPQVVPVEPDPNCPAGQVCPIP
ncbi:hypothetical protein [Nocardioides sp.]|uniref:hypothetical protein n=1 Tax=Nocardioides sp. TaxID=35761 RepID=UPI0027193CD1|nr:hypothetical protein [Nocardioides sp.]MDO9455277.1 hypothetical protein [Nocardioides sp.]